MQIKQKEKIISIILPSYNVAPYIEECLNSAFSQTLSGMEILCVDAKSEDGTLEILEAYKKRACVYCTPASSDSCGADSGMPERIHGGESAARREALKNTRILPGHGGHDGTFDRSYSDEL